MSNHGSSRNGTVRMDATSDGDIRPEHSNKSIYRRDKQQPNQGGLRRNVQSFKLIRGKNEGTAFVYLDLQISSTGRPIKLFKDRDQVGLTSDQSRYIYEKVQRNSLINVETIKQ